MTAARALKRLAAMDRDELRFRSSTAIRRGVARLAFAARRPAWRRQALTAVLRRDDSAIAPVLTALSHGDCAGAHQLLMRHFASRESRFVIAPSERESLSATIRSWFPTVAVEATDRADRAMTGAFDLLGYRNLSFTSSSGDIDWQFDPVHKRRASAVFWSCVPYLDASLGDHKIIWELNRHQYWIQLGRAYWLSGDPCYRAGFAQHLDSWMAANPPLTGVNWASMLELALRSISWLWALHLFADPSEDLVRRDGAKAGSPWTIDLLLGLDRQLSLVEQNLSRYFSPNTHLLGEALALYVAGRALPELRRAADWERLGRHVLIEQIASQILPDGGHAERSTHYHRYTLDFYLLALAIALKTADPAAATFADAARRLARFARAIASDSGKLPALGDDDGGALFTLRGGDPGDVSGSLQIAALLLDEPELSVGAPAEEAVWMTGRFPVASGANPWPSTPLPDAGYYVSRSGRGDHLTIDAGPLGFLNGGHAHADALSITLSVRGRPLLIDPGTACYTIDPAMRDRFRSTRAHNTLTLDDRSQSVPGGPFHWKSAAAARALDWRTQPEFDYVEASHDGYAPVVHHRAVLSRPGTWIVVDRVRGSGRHRADLFWHLDPIWNGTTPGRDGVVRAEHPDGTVVWLLALHVACDLFRGKTGESELGWCAPVYGRLEPATTVRMRKEGDAPFAFATAIVESADQPVVEDVRVIGPGRPIGFRITTASWVDTAIFTGSANELDHGRDLWRIGPLFTRERVGYWREPRSPIPLDKRVAFDRDEALQSDQAPPIAIEPGASETRLRPARRLE